MTQRGISSVGRAFAWHAKGHRFKSVILHLANGQNHHSQGHLPWKTSHQKPADNGNQNVPIFWGDAPGFDKYRHWRKKTAARLANEQREKNDMANSHGDHGPAQDRGP